MKMKLISRFQGSKVPNFFLGTLKSDTGLICPNPTLLPFHGTQSEFFLCPVNRSFRQALAVSNAVEIAGMTAELLNRAHTQNCSGNTENMQHSGKTSRKPEADIKRLYPNKRIPDYKIQEPIQKAI